GGLQRFDHAFPAYHALVLGPRDRYVALVPADLDLWSVADRAALLIHPAGHGRLASAVADRLDFADLVGPGQQVLAALEQLAAKVGPQAVAQHRDVQRIDHFAELPHLAAGQELCLVHQHAVQWAAAGHVPPDQRLQVVARAKPGGLRAQSDARGHRATA